MLFLLMLLLLYLLFRLLVFSFKLFCCLLVFTFLLSLSFCYYELKKRGYYFVIKQFSKC